MNVLPFLICCFWKRLANVLYLAKGRAGVKWRMGIETHLKFRENLMIFDEMSLKPHEDDRYHTRHGEVVAAVFKKCVSTQRLLWCEFPQAAACLPGRMFISRARDACGRSFESARRRQETFLYYKKETFAGVSSNDSPCSDSLVRHQPSGCGAMFSGSIVLLFRGELLTILNCVRDELLRRQVLTQVAAHFCES